MEHLVVNIPWQQSLIMYNTFVYMLYSLLICVNVLSISCVYMCRPVHFLSPSHRIVYTLAAGALAGTFINLFLMSENSWIRTNDPYLTAFLNCE